MEKPAGYDEATSSTLTQSSSVFDGATKNPSLKYAPISIAWTDRIRLLRFPEHTTERISAVLRAAWPKGIQHVKLIANYPEIKLKGNPFAFAMDDEKIAIRRCFLEIFDVLAQEGWGVHPVLAGTGRIGTFGTTAEKDCIVFQRQPAQRLSWLCVSFDSSSYIHLVNNPPEFAQPIIHVFKDRVEKCNRDLVSGNFEIKFRDGPWSGPFKNAVSSRLIILDVLRCLEKHGYEEQCQYMVLLSVMRIMSDELGLTTIRCSAIQIVAHGNYIMVNDILSHPSRAGVRAGVIYIA